MIYLLDVNVLVALAIFRHDFHQQVAAWVRGLASKPNSELATCSITELGFVRVLMLTPQYGFTLPQARDLLARLKTSEVMRFSFIPDDQDISQLPPWVKSAKQTTDGHLFQLARSKGATLATLDRRIPRAYLIPAAK